MMTFDSMMNDDDADDDDKRRETKTRKDLDGNVIADEAQKMTNEKHQMAKRLMLLLSGFIL